MIGVYFLYKVLKERAGHYLAYVPEKWFLLPEEKKLYKKIRDFVYKYGELPKAGQEPGGYDDQPLEFYREELRKRYLRDLIMKIKSAPVPEDPQAMVTWLYSEIINTIGDSYSDRVIIPDSLQAFMKKQLDSMRLSRGLGIGKIPTGYTGLDLAFGGFGAGKIYTFVARMKQGKTFYLLNMARLVAQKFDTLFISIEMSLNEIARRLLAIELKSAHLLSPFRIPSTFMESSLSSINLKLYLMNGAYLRSMDELFASITAYNPAIVFIDGAYLLPWQGAKSEWEKAKAIIETLSKFALMRNIPIVCSWQLSRGATKIKNTDDIGPEHIAFTDAVAQTSSVVCAVVNSQNVNMKKFHILVNRDGLSGVSLDVHWNFEEMDFSESGTLYTDDFDNLNSVFEHGGGHE